MALLLLLLLFVKPLLPLLLELLMVEVLRRTVTRGRAPMGTAPGSVVEAMYSDIMANTELGRYPMVNKNSEIGELLISNTKRTASA
jgi:hypothetical protein